MKEVVNLAVELSVPLHKSLIPAELAGAASCLLHILSDRARSLVGLQYPLDLFEHLRCFRLRRSLKRPQSRAESCDRGWLYRRLLRDARLLLPFDPWWCLRLPGHLEGIGQRREVGGVQ